MRYDFSRLKYHGSFAKIIIYDKAAKRYSSDLMLDTWNL